MKKLFLILVFISIFSRSSIKDCVFCKIINNQAPTVKIAETEEILVIKDINPKAPIHYLILPKKHIESLHYFEDADLCLAGKMLLMAKKLSDTVSGAQDFKIIINNGCNADQTIFHSHFHFLAGIK